MSEPLAVFICGQRPVVGFGWHLEQRPFIFQTIRTVPFLPSRPAFSSTSPTIARFDDRSLPTRATNSAKDIPGLHTII